MGRLHTTIDDDRKHHYEELAQLKNAHAQERATASAQREEAIKEAAEYKGQLQVLKSQNTELIAKLAERGDGQKQLNQ